MESPITLSPPDLQQIPSQNNLILPEVLAEAPYELFLR